MFEKFMNEINAEAALHSSKSAEDINPKQTIAKPIVSSSNTLYECIRCSEKAAILVTSVTGVHKGNDVDLDLYRCSKCGAEFAD